MMSKKSLTFAGTPSGDGECFCWLVDFGTFQKMVRHWELDLEARKNFNVEQGYPVNQGVYDETWQLYPSHINTLLDMTKKKYRITVTVEEIGEDNEDRLY